MVDLGCGPGNLTVALARSTKAAHIVGVDTSPAMLAEAQSRTTPNLGFELGDLRTWGDASDPVDILVANASLHWVEDHPAVLRRWTSLLKPTGQLAVQVPSNADHPSHQLAAEVAAEPQFAEAFAPLGGPPPDVVARNVLLPEEYAELIFDLGYVEQIVRLQVYGPVLSSTAEIVEWMRGTSLTRFEKVLDAVTYQRFLERYQQRLFEVIGDRRPYYFAFKRILMWAKAPG